MSITEDTKSKFLYDNSILKEYKYWAALLRIQQITIGSMILVSTTGARHLGELSHEAWAEFAEVSKNVERWTVEAFGAEKFNYLALMMKDPEVHFHFVPRYSLPVTINGHTYQDPDWPFATKKIAMELEVEELQRIKSKLVGVIKEQGHE